MPDSFNPYQTWLGLPESVTNPDYFQLLGLDDSVDDPRVIAAAADRAASKVRRCRPGNHAAEWAALLDEIASAKQCLTDQQQRAEHLVNRDKKPITTRATAQSTSTTRATGNPDLFPPTSRPGSRSIGASSSTGSSTPASKGRAPAATPASPMDPMSPITEPNDAGLPMSPAGVPYLQPARPSPAESHPINAMVPTDPAMAPYALPGIVSNPMAPLAYPNPMAAANPVTAPGPMAPVPYAAPYGAAAQPMAAIPVAMPMPTTVPGHADPNAPFNPTALANPTPIADPMAPVNAMAPVGAVPVNVMPVNSMAALNPMAPLPAGDPALQYGNYDQSAVPQNMQSVFGAPTAAPETQPATPQFQQGAAQSSLAVPAVNRSSGALLAAKRARQSSLGPLLLGGSVGLLLLAIAAGVYYINSGSDSELATAPTSTSQTSPTSSSPSAGLQSSTAAVPLQTESQTPTAPRLDDGNSTSLASALENSNATNASEMKADSGDPADASAVPTPENPSTNPDSSTPAKPPTSTPMPEPTVVELPKPTAQELAKLGLAMKKSRESISEHDFDKADAFVEIASEMPRLPEHQAKLDRLKLLSSCVSEYRTAIETAVAGFESGATFKVGDVDVAVVETGPDRIVVRANGQNRRYSISELPMGLAAAIAAQQVPPDDSKTLMLKGAYVLTHPNATDEDLKKAREFLETASGSLDEAKELLLVLQDSYDLK